ncbi:uncharacterized protein LOC122034273 [Zingiber officinale]|uniref:uncharacterized protein LOC122034273 n=1 Tax=Zingiber officinale TaxID=94328 RepID=UPI001C4C05D3|nr:uncharacterized protein LOC122034273 [Zingiber officinale]
MPPPNQARPSHMSSPPASYSPSSVPMPPLHQSDPSHVPSAPVSYSSPQVPYPEQLLVHSDPPDSARNSFAEFRNDRAPLVPIGDSFENLVQVVREINRIVNKPLGREFYDIFKHSIGHKTTLVERIQRLVRRIKGRRKKQRRFEGEQNFCGRRR